jgi:nickel transport protein
MSRTAFRTALVAALLAAGPALAHRLNVFAWIDGAEVVVEAKFASGVRPKVGTVRVYDGDETLIRTMGVDGNGAARFPLQGGEQGLRIEVDAGDGHQDYWILTPDDIARQTGG